jgi:predicted anti-sigma-YlaC factor YlaD
MSEKNRCREVRRLLQRMPKGGCEKTFRLVSDHLSECEACRSLHADLQEMDELLIESKAWFDKVAHESRISRSRIRTQWAALARRRAWRLRAVWAGATALLLVVAGAVALLLNGRGTRSPGDLGTPAPCRVTPSATLEELAEVLCRYQVPFSELPYAADAFAHEPYYPTSLQQIIEPEDTLTALARTTLNLTRRDET